MNKRASMRDVSSGAQTAIGPDRSRRLLTAAARLYYIDGLSQQEIAAILDVSRSTVSRMLAEARQRGIVRISIEEDDLRARELEKQLLRAYPLRRALVVRALGSTPEAVRRAVGYFAAPAVATWITQARMIGVSGGRTLAALIHCLEPVSPAPGVTTVQLMGNIGPTVSDIDALDMSHRLAARFGGTCYTLNAPAFVQDRETRDVFLGHEHNRLIWSLFERLDVAMVGIGALEESAFAERGVLREADFAHLRAAGAVGEICGHFFDEAGRECVTSYRDRVIGIELDTLRRRPEVIGVTNGPNRAAAVRAALRGGLVTSLVIDEPGAEALLAAS